MTQWEATSSSSLPPPVPPHHRASETGALLEKHDDAPRPHIPGRLKSRHRRFHSKKKTINQVLSDGLSMIRATYFPQHCDSDAFAFRESLAARPRCPRACRGWQFSPVLRTRVAQRARTALLLSAGHQYTAATAHSRCITPCTHR